MSTSIVAKKQQQKLADELVRKAHCHFKKTEIESLLKKYRELTKGKLDRSNFRDILHIEFNITDDVIMDRIFKAFDKDNDGLVGMEDWVKGLSVFLRGDLDEHIKFVFEVYDINGDGYISRDEMYQMLKFAVIKKSMDEDPEEGTKDLVEIVIKKLDTDGDHRVSFKDFQEAVEQNPLLIVCLGSCLPDEKCVAEFEGRSFCQP